MKHHVQKGAARHYHRMSVFCECYDNDGIHEHGGLFPLLSGIINSTPCIWGYGAIVFLVMIQNHWIYIFIVRFFSARRRTETRRQNRPRSGLLLLAPGAPCLRQPSRGAPPACSSFLPSIPSASFSLAWPLLLTSLILCCYRKTPWMARSFDRLAPATPPAMTSTPRPPGSARLPPSATSRSSGALLPCSAAPNHCVL